MAIVYPNAVDNFGAVVNPSTTSLSAADAGGRTHPVSHADLGAAIMALETNAAPLAHDHSTTDGNGIWPTNRLAQANTHQSPDTDASITSLHHTLGTSPTQAAAGNHAHDYAGPSIFNQPYMICTSTTRPLDPTPGMVIWETDTNCVRAWSQFPSNNLTSGIAYAYTFNSANSNTSLDSTIFTTTTPTGTAPADGAMGSPSSGVCAWYPGANITCRQIARAVPTGYSVTNSDDQELKFTTGATTLQSRYETNPSPADDGYLRMSTDGQSYVRYSVIDTGVYIYYTTTGPTGEHFLGGTAANTNTPDTDWTCKAIGNTYLVYQGESTIPLLTAVDVDNAIHVGANYRGWGIGMVGAAGETTQLVPNSITQVSITDLASANSGLIWQLLSLGNVPHIRAEAHFEQAVHPLNTAILGFDTLLGDWIPDPFMDTETSQTDITINEPGTYQVHASISWDPAYSQFDNATIGCTINGVDPGRKARNFMRGNGYAPGFAQTQDVYFTYRFQAGDILRVTASHNAEVICWLFWTSVAGLTQMCWVELDFLGP